MYKIIFILMSIWVTNVLAGDNEYKVESYIDKEGEVIACNYMEKIITECTDSKNNKIYLFFAEPIKWNKKNRKSYADVLDVEPGNVAFELKYKNPIRMKNKKWSYNKKNGEYEKENEQFIFSISQNKMITDEIAVLYFAMIGKKNTSGKTLISIVPLSKDEEGKILQYGMIYLKE